MNLQTNLEQFSQYTLQTKYGAIQTWCANFHPVYKEQFLIAPYLLILGGVWWTPQYFFKSGHL